MKPTKIPTQAKKKLGATVAFGPLFFPTANNFSWVRIDVT